MYYINVSLWYQSLVDHFLSDSHLRPQRTIPEKGTGIKNCILNFQEQEWETGIPDSHTQLLGMGTEICPMMCQSNLIDLVHLIVLNDLYD